MPWRSQARPLVLGHRGDRAHDTENTLPAFEAALAAGADGVELDVRLCASGEVVVFHDHDLRRLTGRRDRVDRVPWSELRRVRLPGDRRVPRLAEVLASLGDALINIEIKRPPLPLLPRLVEAVAAELGAARTGERLLVSSFDPRVLALLRVRSRRVDVGLLCHARQARPLRNAWLAGPLGARAVHPEDPLVTASSMRRWRRAGLRVHVWTVDDPARLAELAALGVDAVICDDPGAAVAALAGAARPGPESGETV